MLCLSHDQECSSALGFELIFIRSACAETSLVLSNSFSCIIFSNQTEHLVIVCLLLFFDDDAIFEVICSAHKLWAFPWHILSSQTRIKLLFVCLLFLCDDICVIFTWSCFFWQKIVAFVFFLLLRFAFMLGFSSGKTTVRTPDFIIAFIPISLWLFLLHMNLLTQLLLCLVAEKPEEKKKFTWISKFSKVIDTKFWGTGLVVCWYWSNFQ